MQALWAPWRGQYLLESVRQSRNSCFLCEALADDRDAENVLVWRGSASAVFLNRYPYNNGHLLVCPLKHQGALVELEGPALLEPIQTIQWMMGILERMLKPQGFNVGLNQGKAAGAGLPGHLHWHIVPRWDGDTNFMPVLGESRVIAESLSSFYDRLIQEIARDGRQGVEPGLSGVVGGSESCS